MLIVIEGPDRTGKSSLAQRIADKVNGRVIHAGPPTKHPLEEYETALDTYDPRGQDHLILDRWHLGEYVWPAIFKRETLFNRACQIHLAMYMRSRGAFFIHADRDPRKLGQELIDAHEPIGPAELPEVRSLFDKALKDVGAHGVWDYERHTDVDVDNFIDNARSNAVDVGRIWNRLGPGWVGTEQPHALIVGDELGPLKPGTTPPEDIPFAPYAATSGRYLLDSFTEKMWRGIALVNSVSGRNQARRDLMTTWEAFGSPRVVALGQKASERLERWNVPHQAVPHPQHWRRFRYNDREDYISMIKEAAGF